MLTALDGLDISLGDRHWSITPYGMWENSRHRWIQTSLTGPTTHILTLKLPRGAGLDEAVSALSAWLANPVESQDVLNVA